MAHDPRLEGCLIVALIAGSCGVERLHRPLDLAPSTRSLVLAFELGGELVAVARAIEASGQQGLPIAADPESLVVALEYDQPLAALGLEEGVVRMSAAGIPLPESSRMWTLAPSASVWESAIEVPSLAERVRYSSAAPQMCRAEGACQRHVGGFNFACSEACTPSISPAPPTPPASRQEPLPPSGLARICPESWQQRASRSLSWCEPPAAVVCPPGSHQALDDPRCEAVDSCTRAGAIPSDAIWVAPGGAGDGSRANPLGDLGAASSAARAGQTIALTGAGALNAATVDRSVRIVGRCDGDVTLEALTIAAPGVSVIGATILGQLEVRPGAQLSLDGARIVHPSLALTIASGASVTARLVTLDGGVAVEGTLSAEELASESATSPNFTISGDGALTLRRARLRQRGPRGAIEAAGPRARVELNDTWIAGTVTGISARGAEISLERSGVDDASLALSEGARLDGTDVVLTLGMSVVAVSSAQLDLSDLILTVDDASEVPPIAVETGTLSLSRVAAGTLGAELVTARSSSVAASDLAIEAGRGARGSGVRAAGGSLDLQRARLGSSSGIFCSGGARAQLLDTFVEATSGPALSVIDCTMAAQRVEVTGLVRAEARSEGGVASASFVDADLAARGDDLGVSVRGPIEVRLERARLRGAPEQALFIREGARLTATDVEIDATDAVFGVRVSSASSVALSRVTVRGGRVALSSSASALEGADIDLDRAETGLSVDAAQTQLALRRVLARNSSGAGISLARVAPEYRLDELEVRDNAVGVELARDQPVGDVLSTMLFVRNQRPAVACDAWPCISPQ